MPWKETCLMDQRMKFIGVVKTGAMSMSEACTLFGVSRKTGYKWLERYETRGIAGLEERSRAPKFCSWALSSQMKQRLLEAKRQRPSWGPVTLLSWLQTREPWVKWPAASTVGDLFKREGLVRERRRRRKPKASPTELRQAQGPNELWCVDFKGDFVVGHRRCYPLTATDSFSRFLLGCDVLDSTSTHNARPVFERLFREYGLPDAIRSDNGAPFASTGLGGLTSLSVWWIRLGIRLERIDPGSPQQNGRHERMHRTLKEETCQTPADTFEEQQSRFNGFRAIFNSERPHQGVGRRVPGSLYRPSPLTLPATLPELQYPSDHLLCRVRSNGNIRWRGHNVHVTNALAGEIVGLVETDEDRWKLLFGHQLLAILDDRGSAPTLASAA
jgi:transposase InsO family protein